MTQARRRPERPMVAGPEKKRKFEPRRFYLFEHAAPPDQPVETQWLNGFEQAAGSWLPAESLLCWYRPRGHGAVERACLLAASTDGDRFEIGLATWNEGMTHREFWLKLPERDSVYRLQVWEHLLEIMVRRRRIGP